MDLLLHVGLHKTGTTTVQNFLYENRNELLQHGILYPDVAMWGSQHALIPISKWPHQEHQHPFLKNLSKDQFNLDYHLGKLKKSLEKYEPSLTIMSSELWSEISCMNYSFSELISHINPLFSKITIFVSKRNLKSLALSALKHSIRHRQHDFLIKNKKYIEFYFDRLKDTKRINTFWENCSLPVITKNLEESSGNLVDFYFGDIVKTYNQDARKILQNNKETIVNQETVKPYKYLLLCMFDDINTLSAHHVKFIKDNKKKLKQISNEQLILFLKYFEKKYEENNLNNISFEDKIQACRFAQIIQ
jgi:hypothetical protein